MLPLGIALVVGASLDALWTTFWLEAHAGPIAGRVTKALHALATRVARARGDARTPDHRLLSLEGPVMLVATFWLWILMTWGGWVLAFSANPAALVDPHTGRVSTLADRTYFVGYTIFTMGNGDLAPRGGGWQFATALACFSGFAMVSLAITYQVQVVSAVVAKRSFATQVFALGETSEMMILNAWDGAGLPGLELQLFSVVEQLQGITEQHRAYPMLHYYHAEHQRDSAGVAVAALDEALLILRWGLDPALRIAPSTMRIAREAVSGFLATLGEDSVHADAVPPPAPSLAMLRDAGIPMVDDATFARAVEATAPRRRMLRGVLTSDTREWPPAA